MEHGAFGEVFFQLLFKSFQVLKAGSPKTVNRLGADGASIEIEAELGDARLPAGSVGNR